MTISANYTTAPGEDPGELGPNDFTAGGALSLNCIVQGDSGSLTYAWSVMGNPDTPPECGSTCNIDTSSNTSTLIMASSNSFFSFHAGNYTCTVSESGRPDSDNSDDFTVRVVGKRMCTLCTVLYHDIPDNHPGAGIFGGGQSYFSVIGRRPIANNGLIVGASDGLRLECISNSSQSGVGMITGVDGNTVPFGITGNLRVSNPGNRPGVLRFHTTYNSPLQAADQGIYTCTIPDSNNNHLTVNVGLYPSGFMGELYMEDTSVILSQVLKLLLYDT